MRLTTSHRSVFGAAALVGPLEAAGAAGRYFAGGWHYGHVSKYQGTQVSEQLSEAQEGEQLSDVEKAGRLSQLTELVDMVRPIIQQDGGDLVLVSADVVSGVVELQLQGACSSCAISASTLQAGVERILKDRLPWVKEVLGGVDEDIDWDESYAMGRGGYVPKW